MALYGNVGIYGLPYNNADFFVRSTSFQYKGYLLTASLLFTRKYQLLCILSTPTESNYISFTQHLMDVGLAVAFDLATISNLTWLWLIELYTDKIFDSICLDSTTLYLDFPLNLISLSNSNNLVHSYLIWFGSIVLDLIFSLLLELFPVIGLNSIILDFIIGLFLLVASSYRGGSPS